MEGGPVERLRDLAGLCTETARALNQEPLNSMASRLTKACEQVGKAWCGSWFGYHAHIYVEGFRSHGPDDEFNINWGISRSSGGPWIEYDAAAVEAEILRRAGISDVSRLQAASEMGERTFEEVQQELAPLLDALADADPSESLQEKKKELNDLKSHISETQWLVAQRPKLLPIPGDERALSEGTIAPHHLAFQARLVRQQSSKRALDQLAKLALYTANYTEKRRMIRQLDRLGAKAGGKVFLVHGHDETLRLQVSEFVRRATGAEPIVLAEQPGQSRTLIEKFEQHANEVGFAVVLMTGDDEGRSAQPPKPHGGLAKKMKPRKAALRPRARQNVVLELGYFLGRLGRNQVCALFEEGVEMPSDYNGVEYVPIDANGGWKQRLGRELRQAGLAVDLNKVL